MNQYKTCKAREEFDAEDIKILGSITPRIRNGQYRAHCNLQGKVDWPYIFCEQIREKGLCPEGYE
jgi:hypothetical protein